MRGSYSKAARIRNEGIKSHEVQAQNERAGSLQVKNPAG